MQVPLTAVEMFSGIGGFRLACDRLGITTVWANDNNAETSHVYRTQFGDDVFLEADIRAMVAEVPKHSLLTAGFPCQPFSSAGKKAGTDDPRGDLFQYIVRVLRATQPSYFVLENVKRILTMDKGRHFSIIIAALTGAGYDIEWRLVNAAAFDLPQNRQRVLIAGVRRDLADASMRLVSPEELAMTNGRALTNLDDTKRWSLLASNSETKPFSTWGLAREDRFFNYSFPPFDSESCRSRLQDVLEPVVDQCFDYTDSTLQRISESEQVDSLVQGVRVLWNQQGGARMGYTVFGTDGLAPTLTASTSRHFERYQVGDQYRRLTPVEYERLQGFPDGFTHVLTNSQRYVVLGNALPPPMAEWAISRVLTPSGVSISDVDMERALF